MVASQGQPKGRSRGAAGAILVGIGALLLALAGAYYGYGLWARSNLDDLNVTRTRPSEVAPSTGPKVIRVSAVIPETGAGSAVLTPAEAPVESEPPDVAGATAPAPTEDEGTGDDAGASTAGELPAEDDGAGEDAAASATTDEPAGEGADALIAADAAAASGDGPSEPATLNTDPDVPAESITIVAPDDAPKAPVPAAATQPEAGAVPQEMPEEPVAAVGDGPVEDSPVAIAVVDPPPEPEPEDPRVALIAKAIEVSSAEAAMYSPPSMIGLDGTMALATRIRIPAINIDSDIKELGVIRSGDSAAWETPKHVVGHIPTTAIAGDAGQGWYFGHLESPIRGEGNVFRRLPEIAELLKLENGGPIYIFLESEHLKFVYQVYHTTVVPQEELRITDSGSRDVTLVTCTPRFYYDQRLLVTAALVGVIES